MTRKQVYAVHPHEIVEAAKDDLITRFNRTFVQALYQLLADDAVMSDEEEEPGDDVETRIASRFMRLASILNGETPATIVTIANITNMLAVAHVAADKAAANEAVSVSGKVDA